MSESTCHECGATYVSGSINYCPRCGAALLTALEPEKGNHYDALRFVSGMLVFLGWLVLIFGWGYALSSYNVTYNLAERLTPHDAEYMGWGSLQNFAGFLSLMSGVFSTIVSLCIIAGGEMIRLFIEMRDDLHKSTNLLRRFVVAMMNPKP